MATGKPAVIGALKDLGQMVAGTKGTWISGECEGIG
jgi:carbamate kinase